MSDSVVIGAGGHAKFAISPWRACGQSVIAVWSRRRRTDPDVHTLMGKPTDPQVPLTPPPMNEMVAHVGRVPGEAAR